MSIKVLIPSGALGLGFSQEALKRGLAEKPDIIAIDGGSTDSGPYYLGSGTSKYSRQRTKAEWAMLMEARAQIGVPLLIGTAGTCGTDATVDWLTDITREIASSRSETPRICTVKCSQPTTRITEALAQGDITTLSPCGDLGPETVESCTNIVALAGVEQITHALDTGADIVIAGRTTDTAVIAALPIARGCHPGAAWHGAKIGECGALATTRPSSGVILLEFDADGVTITPMDPAARATPRTVSSHMLYENSDPIVLYEPGGHLDVSKAAYSEVGERAVRIEGSAWVPSETYTVKLEGAGTAGYQTLSHVLIRDERYVNRVEEWCAKVLADFQARATDVDFDSVSIDFRLIGKNATLGALENRTGAPVEIGVMVIVTAQSQAEATEIARALNPALLHLPLEADEPLPTFAFPFSPPETERGLLYEFRLNHVMALADPLSAFRFEVIEV